jgi:hypothetical protein
MSRGDDLVSNVRVVDANRPRDDVHKEILRRVGDLAPSGRVVRSTFGKDLERRRLCDLAGHDGLEPLHNEGPAPPTMKAVSR